MLFYVSGTVTHARHRDVNETHPWFQGIPRPVGKHET